MSTLQHIRQLVLDRRYYLSAHAEEEMWADGLERPDIERSILRGRIEKRMTEDVRGTRYRIEGPARDERLVSHNLSISRGCGPADYHCICSGGGIMNCEFCDGKTIKKKVRKVHWFAHQLYIVDDVEVEVCQECGERYYHATTLDAIDRMLQAGRQVIKQELQVQVVAMPA